MRRRALFLFLWLRLQQEVLPAQQTLHGTAQPVKISLCSRLAGNEDIQPLLHPGQQGGDRRAEAALDAVALDGAAELLAHREPHLEGIGAHIQKDELMRAARGAAPVDVFELRVLFEAVPSLQDEIAPLKAKEKGPLPVFAGPDRTPLRARRRGGFRRIGGD